MLSSYFDIRARREDRREDQRLRRKEQAAAEANAERRHREKMELRREDAEREESECWHWGQERRHREIMLMLAVIIGERRRQERDDLLRTMQGVIDDLRAENARLRSERSDAARDR